MDIWPVKTCHLLPKVCGVRKPRGPVNLISNGNSVITEVVLLVVLLGHIACIA